MQKFVAVLLVGCWAYFAWNWSTKVSVPSLDELSFGLARASEADRAYDATDLTRRAEAGDPAAQFELGIRLRNGGPFRVGLDAYGWRDAVDPETLGQALEWIRKAQASRHQPATDALAAMSAQGLSAQYRGLWDADSRAPLDPQRAARLAAVSAAAGDLLALDSLGEAYLDGYGVAQDLARGIELLRLFVSLRDRRRDQAYEEARRLVADLESGALSPDQLYRRGVLSMTGGQGMRQDHRKAIRYFRLAASREHPMAPFLVPVAFQKWIEKVRIRRKVEAERFHRPPFEPPPWHTLAPDLPGPYQDPCEGGRTSRSFEDLPAEDGLRWAAVLEGAELAHIPCMVEEARVVLARTAQLTPRLHAVRDLEFATRFGSVAAHYWLGQVHLQGAVGEKDLVKAAQHLRTAADRGDEASAALLASLGR